MMKKNLFSLMLVLSVLIMSSCQDDEIYSCDPRIDQWTKENLDDISTMTRAQWLEINEEVSIAAYRAFDAKQKQNFWIDKIQEVLSLDWNEAEEAHLSNLLTYVDTYFEFLFAKNIEENEQLFNEFEKFTYKWIEYAEEELGWSRALIGAIIASGDKLEDKEGNLSVSITRNASWIDEKVKPNDKGRDCSCSVNSDWCSGSDECYDYGCTDSSLAWGCGTFFAHRCTGICHPDLIIKH